MITVPSGAISARAARTSIAMCSDGGSEKRRLITASHALKARVGSPFRILYRLATLVPASG